MGDTDLFSDMALIAELYAPKIGLVPLHNEREDGRARCQAIFQFRYRDPMSLRNL
jgi:hypothetical protein